MDKIAILTHPKSNRNISNSEATSLDGIFTISENLPKNKVTNGTTPFQICTTRASNIRSVTKPLSLTRLSSPLVINPPAPIATTLCVTMCPSKERKTTISPKTTSCIVTSSINAIEFANITGSIELVMTNIDLKPNMDALLKPLSARINNRGVNIIKNNTPM